MQSSLNRNVKYVDFNHLILLSWNIYNASIVDLVKLSTIVTPHNLHNIIPSSEFFILSTCNRVEIYIYSENTHDLLKLIKKFITTESPNDKYIFNSSECLEGIQAYFHLVKVTSGLKSLAMGEYQIQGQVKDSYKNAMRERNIGRYLISIIESALRTGKRVRSETSIGHKFISLSSLAIDILFEINKPIEVLPILIVGTGKMCNLAAEYFVQMKYKSIIFFSNVPDEREAISRKYKASVLPISDLPKRTQKNNIIFSAVSPHTPRISLKSLGEYWHTFSIIDLSFPKYIIHSEIDVSYSHILDIEDIKLLASSYLPRLQPELDKCEHIIHEEINRFISDNRRRRELNISHSYI